MIKVAIAEDILQIAEALKRKVELSTDMEVVFVSRNGREIFNQIQKGQKVDVLLMDINMPEMNGIEATEKILAINSQIKIVMCSVYDTDTHVFQAILAGASGYLLKDESPQKIHRAIFEALEGGIPMSRSIAQKAIAMMKNTNSEFVESEEFNLTEREKEILESFSKGQSYEQVADSLGISYGTVRKHTENVYRKLHVNNKLDAVKKAERNRII